MSSNPLTILVGDVREKLRELPDESANCVVTSPPYWGLRDYGVAGQLGLEPTLDEYIKTMTGVFEEVRRVLRSDGTLWLNLGSTYASGDRATYRSGASENKGQDIQNDMPRPKTPHGYKPKDLIPIPWLVVMAMQAAGWWLRCDIVWHKPNPMPESCEDRPTKAHEYIFLMTKSTKYWYDNEAIREPSIPDPRDKLWGTQPSQSMVDHRNDSVMGRHGMKTKADGWIRMNNPAGRNKRSVWTVPSEPMSLQVCAECNRLFTGSEFRRLKERDDRKRICLCGASNWISHFATFPQDLITPCILAGCPAETCAKCGEPWVRETKVAYSKKGLPIEVSGDWHGERANEFAPGHAGRMEKGNARQSNRSNVDKNVQTLGFRPTCDCDCKETVPGIVLDPFLGSGTCAKVALELGRRAIGIELNPAYITQVKQRTETTIGLSLA